jgi:hypothetical protein
LSSSSTANDGRQGRPVVWQAAESHCRISRGILQCDSAAQMATSQAAASLSGVTWQGLSRGRGGLPAAEVAKTVDRRKPFLIRRLRRSCDCLCHFASETRPKRATTAGHAEEAPTRQNFPLRGGTWRQGLARPTRLRTGRLKLGGLEPPQASIRHPAITDLTVSAPQGRSILVHL